MKRTFITFIVTLLMVFAPFFQKASAQTSTQNQKITINASDLTPEQLAKAKSDANIADLKNKLATYGDWVGVGGEIGKGVNDALNAVVNASDKFGKTKVGEFTMIMVAWKIMGKDLIRIILGIIFLIIITTFLFKSYKNSFITHKIVTKGNGWKFWEPKEYKIVEPLDYEGSEFVKFLYVVIMFAQFGICYAIMFA